MRFRYSYKNYPHSPKATQKSKILGMLTSLPYCILYSFFWVALLSYFLEKVFQISYNITMPVSFISLIGLFFIIRKLKKDIGIKIEQLALEDFLRHHHKD